MIILTHSNYVCNRQLVMTYIGILLSILCQVQFLKRAVDILCQCRQTLMFTYVFAYYLRKNNQSLIFEANQKDLESATETLSEYLERDITSENLADIKQKVQDKYRYNTSDWWFWSKCERHVRAKIIMLFSFNSSFADIVKKDVKFYCFMCTKVMIRNGGFTPIE